MVNWLLISNKKLEHHTKEITPIPKFMILGLRVRLWIMDYEMSIISQKGVVF